MTRTKAAAQPAERAAREAVDEADFACWTAKCDACTWRRDYGVRNVVGEHLPAWIEQGWTGTDVRNLIKTRRNLAEAGDLLAVHGGLTDDLRLILSVEAALA